MCKIEFEIPQAGYVTVKVVDIIGSPVTTLINSHKEPGKHLVNLNTEELPPAGIITKYTSITIRKDYQTATTTA
ncbi:MAG: hypothetical protein L0Y77_13410 [Chlorobi bacterium]|nr:hypothetical protein [Chlorobiota bacterium]